MKKNQNKKKEFSSSDLDSQKTLLDEFVLINDVGRKGMDEEVREWYWLHQPGIIVNVQI